MNELLKLLHENQLGIRTRVDAIGRAHVTLEDVSDLTDTNPICVSLEFRSADNDRPMTELILTHFQPAAISIKRARKAEVGV